MDKIAYKFISQEKIENSEEPIILVVTAASFRYLARCVIGEERELTDIELNRLAHLILDPCWDNCINSDSFFLTLLEAAINTKDAEWKEVDDKFKARQQSVSKAAGEGKKVE